MVTHNSHPEDVKALVRKTGIPFAELVERTGLHKGTLSHALRRPIPAANQAIAAFLRIPLHELWPEWYDEHGQRRPGVADHSAPTRINRRQKRRQAADGTRAA